MKTTEQFFAFSQGNLEAVAKSGQIWASGLQDLGNQLAASGRAQFAETVSALKALAGAKTLNDGFEMQAALTRAAIEKTIIEAGRFAETSVRLAEQAWAPMTARVGAAAQTFGSAA